MTMGEVAGTEPAVPVVPLEAAKEIRRLKDEKKALEGVIEELDARMAALAKVVAEDPEQEWEEDGRTWRVTIGHRTTLSVDLAKLKRFYPDKLDRCTKLAPVNPEIRRLVNAGVMDLSKFGSLTTSDPVPYVKEIEHAREEG